MKAMSVREFLHLHDVLKQEIRTYHHISAKMSLLTPFFKSVSEFLRPYDDISDIETKTCLNFVNLTQCMYSYFVSLHSLETRLPHKFQLQTSVGWCQRG